MKILDCHVHYARPISPREIIFLINKSNTDCFNLVLVPDRQLVNSICDAMVVKSEAKNRCYVFASLDVSKYFMAAKHLGKEFVKYAIRMNALGADGIKIIEGKPNIRKGLPIPDFDLEVWDPFWEYCEKSKTPILMHLNDPEEFWDKKKIPSWAKKQGWFYDSSYINNEKQYTQMLNVLKKHPNLKIIFAHFFFMSKQLKRLSDILNAYPNVMVDLTPGIEMYINFQENMKATKAFFNKYQKRIIYGTDMGARAVLSEDKKIDKDECLARPYVVRGFLEEKQIHVKADNNFLIGRKSFDLKGLHLPKTMLEKIYFDNFVNYVGAIKPINNKLVIKEAKHLKKLIRIMSLFDKQVKKNFTNLNYAIQYFQTYKGGK